MNKRYRYTPLDGRFNFFGSFREGLIFFRREDKSAGYMDAAGNIVTAGGYSDNIAGHFVFPEFREGFAALCRDGGMGLIDRSGNAATDFSFEAVASFTGGLCAAKKGGKWGFIGRDGGEAIPFVYDSVSGFSEGLCAAKKDGKFGFIDRSGAATIPFEYDAADSFFGGCGAVRRGEKREIIDKAGKLRLPYPDGTDDFFGCVGERFCFARRLPDGAVLCGLFDASGSQLLPLDYEHIQSLGSGGYVAVKPGKQEYYSADGKLIRTAAFASLGIYREGVAVATEGDKFCFVNEAGELSARFPEGSAPVTALSEGFATARLKDSFGVICLSGEISVPFEFDELGAISEKKLAARKGSEWGLIDLS